MFKYSKLSKNIALLKNTNNKQAFCAATPPNFNIKKEDTGYIHHLWTREQAQKIDLVNRQGRRMSDKFALKFAKMFTKNMDIMSGYKRIFPWQSKEITDKKWLNRLIFYENATGIPGFIAAIWKHLDSIRNVKIEENQKIHSLLQESENERTHLLILLKTYKPGFFYRQGLFISHFWYLTLFSTMYIFTPRLVHRIVGHIEEEAIKSYSQLLEEIQKENSPVSKLKTDKANQLAQEYWNLDEDATVEDIILFIRKDKEQATVVNHNLADLYSKHECPDPFAVKDY